jgi:sugar lactone lactonase YvrE
MLAIYKDARSGSMRSQVTVPFAVDRCLHGPNQNCLKTDEMGNVWVAANQTIAVFDAYWRRLGEIPILEDLSNCASGDGFRNLNVTTRSFVYRIETKVNGTRTY